jgi:hypothetical protein
MTFEPRGIGLKIIRTGEHLEYLHSWLVPGVERQKAASRLEGKQGCDCATYTFEVQVLALSPSGQVSKWGHRPQPQERLEPHSLATRQQRERSSPQAAEERSIPHLHEWRAVSEKGVQSCFQESRDYDEQSSIDTSRTIAGTSSPARLAERLVEPG